MLVNKPKDSTPDGRKYRMGIFFAGVMLLALGLATQNAIVAELFSELATGLGMLYVVYCGGNVSNKWVLGKNSLTVETDKESK